MAMRRTFRWGWLGLALVIVLLVVSPLRGLTSRALITVAWPVITVGRWLGDRLQLSPTSRQHTAERDQLQRQLTDVTARLYETNQQLEASQALDALAAFTQATKRRIIFANVIATSPDPGIQSIIINRGSDDGLQLGQAVVSDRGSMAGKLVSVHQTFSTVLLLTDRQLVTTGRIQNPSQSPGVVRGERGLTLQMGFIPKTDDVKTGQTVVTTGSEPLIPPDLLIGTVSSVSLRAGDLFQQAILLPAAALRRLRVVGIVIG